jgi:hypothetical protein
MNKSQIRDVFAVTAIALAAQSASAQALGRLRGAALLGQPLDVRIAVPANEASAGLCPSADVFYGDSRINAQAEVIGSGSDQQLRIKTTTPVDEPVVTVYARVGCTSPFNRRYVLLSDFATPDAVDSPLRLPSGSGGFSAAVPRTIVSSPSAAPRLERDESTAASRAARRERAASKAAVRRDRADSAQPKNAPSAKSDAARQTSPAGALRSETRLGAAAATSAGPRLKLESVDLSAPTQGGSPQFGALKPSLQLLSEPGADPKQRAAFAALWKAVNSSPEDIARSTTRLEEIQREVKTLQAADALQKKELAQLAAARQSSLIAWIVAGILGLLALVAGLLAWRSRSTATPGGHKQWWSGGGSAKAEGADSPVIPAKTNPPSSVWQAEQEFNAIKARSRVTPSGTKESVKIGAKLVVGAGAAAAAAAAAADEGDDVMIGGSSASGAFKAKQAARAKSFDQDFPDVDATLEDVDGEPLAKADFAMSLPGVARSVNAEELIDIQQQADFFVSLGQHDQAVELLKEHIASSAETSPLTYLDLLNIYHAVNRRAEYDVLRRAFNRKFNGNVPEFDAYSGAGEGLEAYPKAISRIESLWPTPRVLEVIEESIFRKPESAEEGFDMSAYRELMFLYGVAKELVDEDMQPSRSGAEGQDMPELDFGSQADPDEASSGFPSTRMSPLSTTGLAGLEQFDFGDSSTAAKGDGAHKPDAAADKTRPVGGSRIGLDIDLGNDSDEAWERSGFR